ncbi:N-acetyltransferase 9-like protein isoform X2 [Bacillus rossius redtenbacheri]|uniref:N-acetyltransferase 9-like protein isoform X2 n=1 Tax=Bacillus rossius redtenbacheri TaxID=93214 RepID=UPI002FDD6B56
MSPKLQKLTASEPLSLEEEFGMQESWATDQDKCTFIILDKDVLEDTNNDIEAMIGDTNLFLLNKDSKEKVAEAEIMIAEPAARGKHCGWEAMLLMLRYGAETLRIQKFVAKIGSDNTRSISMFTKMRFNQVSYSNVFKEVTLEKEVDCEWSDWLQRETRNSVTKVIEPDF